MTEDPDAVEDRVETSARRAVKKAEKATAAIRRSEGMKGFSPALVGIVRGVVEAAVLAAITAIIAALSGLNGEAAVYAPIAVALLRSLEGFVDHKIDPTQQRTLFGAPMKPPGK
jgi:hypothetical protein